jgi:hypothetical protein
MTLAKAWSEKKPMVDHLKNFNCETYIFIPSQMKIKFENAKCMFIGYIVDLKVYRLIDFVIGKLIKVSYKVIFNEVGASNSKMDATLVPTSKRALSRNNPMINHGLKE